jgi:modulator of FtsH protease
MLLVSAWDTFFVAQVGASAALAGLLFVSVSINLARILSFPELPGRTLIALLLLLVVMVTSSLALVPEQSQALVGAELLPVGLVVWGITALMQAKAARAGERQYRRTYFVRLIEGHLATLPFALAGLAVLIRGADGLYWLVPGILCCYLFAIQEAWILLIEINR